MILQSVSRQWENKLLMLAHEAGEIGAQTLDVNKESCGAELSQAYARCREITAEHSRTFSMASRLLPRKKREAVRALYAFCRLADNIADGGMAQPEAAMRLLRERIHQAGPLGALPDGVHVLLAWQDARLRHGIPLKYAEQLIDGVSQDLTQRRYASFEELAVYCYGVASTVGLMSMYIIGFRPTATPYAVKMGVALQLTNILRDVGEDYRYGRLYLPLDELAYFGLSEMDIAAQRVDERWREFMRYQIARNRRLYAEAMPGIQHLERSGRFAVRAAATLYEAILADIEAHDFDVFTRRAHVSDLEKARLLFEVMRRDQAARWRMI